MQPATFVSDAATLFEGVGELRARCRALDWSATPLGPVERWPMELRVAAQMVLDAGLPNIVLWGRGLTQLYNDAYAKIIGAKHPYALGRGNEEVWPEVWHINGPIYERVFAGETVTLDDALYPLARTGVEGVTDDTFLTVAFSPIRLATGEVGGVLANMIETTGNVRRRALEAERERLLRALELEQDRLAYVFERAPSFLAVMRGPSHVLTRINDAYLQLVGHRGVLGLTVAEALPEADPQGFVRLLDRVLETGEPFIGREVRVLVQRTPGVPPEERFLDFVYQPLVEGDGTRSGVVTHGTDVTGQVLARREVERARDRAALLQELTAALAAATTREAVAEIVVARGIAATGAATGALFLREAGSPEVAVVRQAGFDRVVEGRYGRFPLSFESPSTYCIRTGEPVWIETADALRARFPAMQDVWERTGACAIATVPLAVAEETVGAMSFTFPADRAFPSGERDFFLALGRQAALGLDRARLFAAEHEARALAEAERARAEEANRAKSDFLAAMSHELRTPLNAIQGHVQLIEMGLHGPVTEAQREMLARVQRSQKYLLSLINDVLNFARIEAGRVEYDVRPTDVADVMAVVRPLVEQQMAARGLHFEVSLPPGPCLALADHDKLVQVLVNLLSNAIKFTEARNPSTGAPGCVRVDVGSRPDAPPGVVFLRVSDTGRGIPRDRNESIFDPFVQLRGHVAHGQAPHSEGIGLGLAISRDLARGMGGDLRVRSEEGLGSTFTITLRRA